MLSAARRLTTFVVRRAMATASGTAEERAQRIVWIDCEMTGLDLDKAGHTLVEIATIVTDENLNIVAEGPDIVINQTEAVLERMDPWCKKTFGENGLTEKIRASNISLAEAERMTMDFLRTHTDQGKSPLAGNTVHVDRRFLIKYMPQIDEHLHYRIIDVSTVKELTRRWYPATYKQMPAKAGNHRALDDIRESIKELQFYRANVFADAGKA